MAKESLRLLLENEKIAIEKSNLKRKTYRKVNFLSVLCGHLLDTLKRRAKKKNLEVSINSSYIREIWIRQKGICPLTGVELKYIPQGSNNFVMKNPFAPSIDRIDQSKGYIKENIRIICFWANNSRYTFTDEVFINMCKKVAHINK